MIEISTCKAFCQIQVHRAYQDLFPKDLAQNCFMSWNDLSRGLAKPFPSELKFVLILNFEFAW